VQYYRWLILSFATCGVIFLSACQGVAPAPVTETNPQLELAQGGALDPQYVKDYAYAKAFVWANQPTAVSYTPSTSYQYNNRFDQDSFGNRNVYPAADNTITRLGTGSYRVELPNFNFFGGVVHTSAYNSSSYCNVIRWFPNGTKLEVYVSCYTPAGQGTDTLFTMFFYKNARNLPTHGLAYLLANSPSTSSYTPTDIYQYNSRGAKNTITRSSVGQYTVNFPKMQLNANEQGKGGTVQVTAYGSRNACKVGGWGESAGTVTAAVRCYSPSGVLTDSLFTASFMREPGTIGIVRDSDESTAHYVWANSPTSASYTPSTFYQAYSSASANLSAITRSSTGQYTVTIPGLKAFDDTLALVTAYGSSSNRCSIGGWGGSPVQVSVNCYTAGGTLADDFFVLYYLAK
jgi:hypothetical protein